MLREAPSMLGLYDRTDMPRDAHSVFEAAFKTGPNGVQYLRYRRPGKEWEQIEVSEVVVEVIQHCMSECSEAKRAYNDLRPRLEHELEQKLKIARRTKDEALRDARAARSAQARNFAEPSKKIGSPTWRQAKDAVDKSLDADSYDWTWLAEKNIAVLMVQPKAKKAEAKKR